VAYEDADFFSRNNYVRILRSHALSGLRKNFSLLRNTSRLTLQEKEDPDRQAASICFNSTCRGASWLIYKTCIIFGSAAGCIVLGSIEILLSRETFSVRSLAGTVQSRIDVETCGPKRE
jgi:hypothetical protein